MRISIKSRIVARTGFSASKKARILMLAIAPVAALMASNAVAASQTWDPSQTGGSDGSGNWDLSSLDWTGGAWVNGNTATFGSGGSAGTVTITAPGVSAAGITFNLGYTIVGPGNLTLSGPVSVAAGQNAIINAPIAGTSGLALVGPGNLTLGGTNTYTGNTSLDGGSLIFSANNAIGQLNFGPSAQTTNAGTLDLTNANLTTTGIIVQTNSATTNSILIGAGKSLTVTGQSQFGTPTTTPTALVTSTTVSGTGSFTADSTTSNANFIVGVGSGNNTNGQMNATLDLSGLSNFTYNTGATGTGGFYVGVGTRPAATLKLANVNNTIITANLTVGDSSPTPGFSGLGSNNNNGANTNLQLGNGTNVIDATTIILGRTKAQGSISFLTTAGSVTIAGQAGGTSRANITLGTGSSATSTNSASALSLAGHTANVLANIVAVGNLAGSTAGSSIGTVTFDTGTFDVNTLLIGNYANGTTNTSTNGSTGTFTLGGATPNNTATGVLNVNTALVIGANAVSASTQTTHGNLIINGGTANVFSDITRTGSATTGNLTLNGGTLNMNGHAIGSAASTITTVLANSTVPATLSNLGGTGINGAGLNMNGTSTLILEGTNTYSGTTTISSGTLQVGSGAGTGTLGTGDVAATGNLTFNRSGTYTYGGNITGAGGISQIGSGTVVLSGPNVNVSGSSTLTAGTLASIGTLGNLSVSGGRLLPGTSANDGSVGTINVASLTVTGGELRFDIAGASQDQVLSSGAASFTGGNITLNIVGSAAAGYHELIGSTGLTGAPTLLTTSIGRTNFALDTSTIANAIGVVVSGSGPASLVWNGASSNTWNTQGAANFLNGAAQDVFFTNDAVTFNDSNGGHYNVTISGQVAPGSITVNNSAGDYVFSGADANSGISGDNTFTKSGSGNLSIASNNTATGDLVINGGNVTLASGGVLNRGNISVASGASFTVASGGNFTSTPNVTDNGTVNLNNPTRTIAALNGSGAVNLNGTALTVSGGGIFTGTIAGTGSLILTGPAFQIGNGGTSGSISVPTTINAGGTLAINLSSTPFAGTISGAGGIQILSSGTQVLSGAVSYTGATALTNGSLQLTGANTDTIGPMSGSNNLIVGDGSVATTASVSGASTFTGSTTVNSGSKLIIPLGNQIATTSGVTVNNATVVFGNNTFTNNWGPNAITVGPGSSTLQYTLANTNGLGNATVGAAINIGANNLAIDINDSNANSTKNAFNVPGAISGSGNLSIINSGTWNQDTVILAGTNSMSGNLLVGPSGAGVRVEINNAGGLGTSTVTQTNGSQFWINTAGSYNNNVSIVGIGTPVDSPTFGAMRLNNNVTMNGTISLTGDALVTAGTNGSNQVTLNGQVTGAHQLSVQSGVFTLTNAANSWGTHTAGAADTVVGRYNNVQSSTIVLGNASALSTGGLQLAGGGVELNGTSPSVASLSSTSGGSVLPIAPVADTTAGSTPFIRLSSLTGFINGDYVSGNGIPVNTYVSGTATSEAPRGTGTSGQSTINVASVVGILPGDSITGTNIPSGTTITSIAGTTLTLSQALSGTVANLVVTINFASGSDVFLTNALTANPAAGAGTILDGSVISNNGANANNTVATLTTGSDGSSTAYSGLLVDGTSGGKLALAKIGAGAQTLSGANTYSGGTSITGGTIIAANASALGKGGVAIHTGGKLQLAASLSVNGLTFDGSAPNWTGTLDLNGNNRLVVQDALTHATSLANLQSQAHSVISSTGLPAGYGIAVLDNALLNKTTFGGITVDSNSILVGTELLGDANADGTVNGADLNTVLNNFGAVTAAWTSGNFDGAATIDLTDLAAVLNNFGQVNPNPNSLGGISPAISTPEPASLALLALAAPALLTRRRKA